MGAVWQRAAHSALLPPHLASAFTFPLVQVLIQGIVSPNPALYSEGFSQACQLDQVALHAGDLPQSESRAVTAAWMARERTALALSYTYELCPSLLPVSTP